MTVGHVIPQLAAHAPSCTALVTAGSSALNGSGYMALGALYLTVVGIGGAIKSHYDSKAEAQAKVDNFVKTVQLYDLRSVNSATKGLGTWKAEVLSRGKFFLALMANAAGALTSLGKAICAVSVGIFTLGKYSAFGGVKTSFGRLALTAINIPNSALGVLVPQAARFVYEQQLKAVCEDAPSREIRDAISV